MGNNLGRFLWTLKDRILQDGTVEEDILRLGVNHQIDVKLLNEIGCLKADLKIKSWQDINNWAGIAIAVIAAQYFMYL